MEKIIESKKARARERVKQLKGFYIHATVFVIINLFIVSTSVYGQMNAGDSFSEAFFNFATFSTPFFWGIGLAFHASKTFGYNPFFSKDWEERQIQKYMEEDRREAEKFSSQNRLR